MELFMKKFERFLFGALLGGFFGSVIVLLFAPENGEETREALRYRFEGFTSQIKEAVSERRAQLLKEIEEYKHQS
jgi:gas vesicle protein